MINGKKVLGIIGGMGPMATVDLYRKVIGYTDARCDNEHIHILIDSNAQVPDRTQAILTGGYEPLPYLLQSARRLEQAGADLLVMTCNAAHFFYDDLCKGCATPILNMIELTAREAREQGYSAVGLLAVDGTVRSGLYDRACEKAGLRLLKPEDPGQRAVMRLIYDEIKAGKPAETAALDSTLADLTQQGAEAFILGCTELPLVFDGSDGRRYLDPTAILARRAIGALGYPIREE